MIRSPYLIRSLGPGAAERPWFHPSTDDADPRILFVQHYNMLCDPRLGEWRAAILDGVRPTDVVLDLGTGTGILALFASERAARVYAVDVDPHLVRYAREVVAAHGRTERIQVLCADARRLELPEKVDVIICEMLDTALIKEYQVRALNHVVRHWLRPGGRVLPRRVVNRVAGVAKDFTFFGYSLPLPHFVTTEARVSDGTLTDAVAYLEVDFRRRNRTRVDVSARLPVVRDGVLSALRLTTDTELAEGHLVGGSHWFNPPLVLPVEPMAVRAGEVVDVSLRYKMGGGMRHLDYVVQKGSRLL